jgi:hypothetical protein
MTGAGFILRTVSHRQHRDRRVAVAAPTAVKGVMR